ncbi:MAG: LamB/YcsF family protein, partial [Solirubrobacteraceae bacterium]|nr:LamB/YcsF family protein [Solirubrobacteraceae bacterium]
ERQARDVIAAIRAIDPSLVLVGLAGSPLLGWAQASGLRTVAEAFADRAYMPDGSLVSRREKGAVLHDAHAVAERMLRLATEGVVVAIDGSTVRLQAESVCVHGDSPGAVEMARQVRALLERSGVTVASFVDTGVAA